MFNIGDIVSVRLKKQERPALIINRYGEDYIVLYITKHVERYKSESTAFVIDNNMLREGTLSAKGIVRLHKQNTVKGSSIVNRLGAINQQKLEEMIRRITYEDIKLFYQTIHLSRQQDAFIPGKSKINYAGRIFDEREIINLIDSCLDFWLTTGRYAEKFEQGLAEFLGAKYCALVNSGSSANLIAFMALTSPKLKDRGIKRGDEVITVSTGFPTTVAPIVQYGAVPVFLDITLPTYNIDCSQLEPALSERTKAVMLAHTLGNPFDVKTVKDFCDKHNLWLIEDNCDALGSMYLYDDKWRYTGTMGHIGTSSFYPPHHITMGEGGAVYTNDVELKRIVESFRDWGRDCWCASGHDDTCKKRFQWQMGALPYGYDHKYTYSHFGYNLKATDMQAAIGCAQLEKLPHFVEARKKNWKTLRERLSHLSDRFILPEPTANSDPSWFGFLLTVREDAGFKRDEIVGYLESKGIQTRMLFAGNLIKHPCFDEMRDSKHGFRTVSDMKNTDRVMFDSFWIGVYPGLTGEMIDYIVDTINEFIQKKGR